MPDESPRAQTYRRPESYTSQCRRRSRILLRLTSLESKIRVYQRTTRHARQFGYRSLVLARIAVYPALGHQEALRLIHERHRLASNAACEAGCP